MKLQFYARDDYGSNSDPVAIVEGPKPAVGEGVEITKMCETLGAVVQEVDLVFGSGECFARVVLNTDIADVPWVKR